MTKKKEGHTRAPAVDVNQFGKARETLIALSTSLAGSSRRSAVKDPAPAPAKKTG